MDITTLIDILVTGGLIINSILIGGSGSWFISYPAMMIVLGGTMGAALLAYPLKEVLGVFEVVRNVFQYRSQSPLASIPLLTNFVRKARQEGILAFENEIEALDDLYISRGLQWVIDGSDTDHSGW